MWLCLLLAIHRIMFISQVVADDSVTTTRAPSRAIVVTFHAPIRIFVPPKTEVPAMSATVHPSTTTTTTLPVLKTTSPKTYTEILPPTGQRCRKFEIQADEEDCKYFYYCWLTGSFRTRCPPGTLFDRNAKRCHDKNFVQCYNGRTCPRSTGLFPDTKFCSMYLNCYQGVPYLRRCPSGLLFHPTSLGQGFCDYSYNVACLGNTIITYPDLNSHKFTKTNPEFDPLRAFITAGLPEYTGTDSDS